MKISKLDEHSVRPLSSSYLIRQEESSTRHPYMYKTVYIITESRFGRIVGINDVGSHFHVEGKPRGHVKVFLGRHLLQVYVRNIIITASLTQMQGRLGYN